MPEYKIPCSWRMFGTMTIEADSLEEAVAKAEDEPLPDRQHYYDDSFQVDHSDLHDDNKGKVLTEADQTYLQQF